TSRTPDRTQTACNLYNIRPFGGDAGIARCRRRTVGATVGSGNGPRGPPPGRIGSPLSTRPSVDGYPVTPAVITLGIRVYSDVILQAADIRLPEGRKDASVPRHRLHGSHPSIPGLFGLVAARPLCAPANPSPKMHRSDAHNCGQVYSYGLCRRWLSD